MRGGMCARGIVAAAALVLAVDARAATSVAVGSAGAVERAGLTQDAAKNGTGASFGAPVTDDRRLFTFRWRLPWLLTDGRALGPSPFVTGFKPTAFAAPGGLSLVAEPTEGASAWVPTVGFGEPHKLAHLQLGALAMSLGHGTLVDRFTNSPEGAPRTGGSHVEVNVAGLGGQVLVADLARPDAFLAWRIYARPLLWFTGLDAVFQPNELDVDPRTEVAGIWVTGFSSVVDREAPSARGVRRVWGASWDNEAAVLDNQLVKAIFTLDWNFLGEDDAAPGVGVHPGFRALFDVLGMRFEASVDTHLGGEGYIPRYFDRLYVLERTLAFGADKAKIDLPRPATWGYQARLQASLFKLATMFVDVSDQIPMNALEGQSSGTLTAGASAWLFFFGGAITASQTGIETWSDPHFFGRGFVVTAEGRLAVLPPLLYLVARTWRAHLPVGDAPGGYLVNDGLVAGLEVNLDFL